ncbi:MAG: hypothetical protein E6K54_08800 [Gammaproteobacteria bacterium]|nr:MAG: hypothetical protein E6K54_08800 [Gammaproteobacteria bacterium]
MHFVYLIKMDNTTENGYKCSLCPRRLASKYSLERHIRLKHKSNSGKEIIEGIPALHATDVNIDQEPDKRPTIIIVT